MLHRRPAWVGDPHHVPCGEKVPREVEQMLVALAVDQWALRAPTVVRRLVPARADDLAGHYLLTSEDGHWVLHLRTERLGENLELAARLAGHAHANGCAVARWRSGTGDHRLELPCGSLWASMTSWLDGRLGMELEAEAAALGSALARLHVALCDCPDWRQVANEADQRNEMLDAAAVMIQSAPLSPGTREPALAAAARRLEGSNAWHGLHKPQVLHGDPTPGNVVFLAEGGVGFLDFEDAPHSYAPPETELAVACLRSCAVAGGEPIEFWTQAAVDAYTQERGWDDVPDLRPLMRAYLDDCLIILTEAERCGVAMPDAEWAKFLRLDALFQ